MAAIAINGRYLHKRVTGVERYAHELSGRLALPARSISPQKALGKISGNLWEQFILPARLRADEMLWSPANAGPWSVRRQIVTLHDAGVFDHPEWFRPAFAAWTRLSWKILARRAKAVVTVSNFSRGRLIHHLQIPAHKIHVIENGVGRPFEPQSHDAIERIREKYSLSKPYFLFVGTIEPRKNLGTLVKAWEKMDTRNHSLVIAGCEGKVFAKAGNHASPIEDGICRIGYVPDADLPALYSGATAVVVPSLYEGFGLPALEGMACGTPTIVSNTTCFPEIVGDAALQVNPDHADEITNAMVQIINSKVLSDTLRARGIQRAAQLTWDESARKLQSLFDSLQ